MFCSSIKKAIWNFMAYAHLFYEFKPENFYNENIVSNLILCIITILLLYILGEQEKKIHGTKLFCYNNRNKQTKLFLVGLHDHKENFWAGHSLKN